MVAGAAVRADWPPWPTDAFEFVKREILAVEEGLLRQRHQAVSLILLAEFDGDIAMPRNPPGNPSRVRWFIKSMVVDVQP